MILFFYLYFLYSVDSEDLIFGFFGRVMADDLPEVEEEDVGGGPHGLGGEDDYQHEGVPHHPHRQHQAGGVMQVVQGIR